MNSLEPLLDGFESMLLKPRGNQLGRIDDLLTGFEQIPQTARTGPFNTFSLLGVEYDELAHSRFLGWLLDPASAHGQGTRFLARFLGLLGRTVPPEAMQKTRVYLEFAEQESIIDIMVWIPGELLVYVENKVLAGEGNQQAYRELRDLRRTGLRYRLPPSKQMAVFLTPGGRRPSSGDGDSWHALSYGQLSSGFMEVLPEVSEPKLCFLIEDWLQTIERFAGG